MFKWFCWRKDFFTSKPSTNYSIATSTADLNLYKSLAETKDLSARIIKKLEDKLEDREALLTEVFNTIHGFLCLKDPEGRWKLLNTFGKKLYGIEGTSYKELKDEDIAKISPRYATSLNQCTRTDKLAWGTQETINIEERSVDTFGNESIFQVTKTPIFDESGNKKYLLIHGVNVTEEYENNKHITLLIKALDQASDSIIVTDHRHKIIYANQAYIDCTGYTLKEILGREATFISTLNSDIQVNLKDTILKGEVWQGPITNKHKDGSLVEGVLTVTPILNGKPYPIYYIGVKRMSKKG